MESSIDVIIDFGSLKIHTGYLKDIHNIPKKSLYGLTINNKIIGPYLFDENLTAELYLNLLSFKLIYILAIIFSNTYDPGISQERIWFQQNGGPPHFDVNIRRYLDQVFLNCWIGRR
ncbi:hypothetical protein ABEB36_006177 [Hypothenemus hampei]|uniref:Uncharacterized protein n=1 Tax=Hypothenemus hampei TaxID=57062 RepID=A0ABD1EPN0_HYPHA